MGNSNQGQGNTRDARSYRNKPHQTPPKVGSGIAEENDLAAMNNISADLLNNISAVDMGDIPLQQPDSNNSKVLVEAVSLSAEGGFSPDERRALRIPKFDAAPELTDLELSLPRNDRGIMSHHQEKLDGSSLIGRQLRSAQGKTESRNNQTLPDPIAPQLTATPVPAILSSKARIPEITELNPADASVPTAAPFARTAVPGNSSLSNVMTATPVSFEPPAPREHNLSRPDVAAQSKLQHSAVHQNPTRFVSPGEPLSVALEPEQSYDEPLLRNSAPALNGAGTEIRTGAGTDSLSPALTPSMAPAMGTASAMDTSMAPVMGSARGQPPLMSVVPAADINALQAQAPRAGAVQAAALPDSMQSSRVMATPFANPVLQAMQNIKPSFNSRHASNSFFPQNGEDSAESSPRAIRPTAEEIARRNSEIWGNPESEHDNTSSRSQSETTPDIWPNQASAPHQSFDPTAPSQPGMVSMPGMQGIPGSTAYDQGAFTAPGNGTGASANNAAPAAMIFGQEQRNTEETAQNAAMGNTPEPDDGMPLRNPTAPSTLINGLAFDFKNKSQEEIASGLKAVADQSTSASPAAALLAQSYEAPPEVHTAITGAGSQHTHIFKTPAKPAPAPASLNPLADHAPDRGNSNGSSGQKVNPYAKAFAALNQTNENTTKISGYSSALHQKTQPKPPEVNTMISHGAAPAAKNTQGSDSGLFSFSSPGTSVLGLGSSHHTTTVMSDNRGRIVTDELGRRIHKNEQNKSKPVAASTRFDFTRSNTKTSVQSASSRTVDLSPAFSDTILGVETGGFAAPTHAASAPAAASTAATTAAAAERGTADKSNSVKKPEAAGVDMPTISLSELSLPESRKKSTLQTLSADESSDKLFSISDVSEADIKAMAAAALALGETRKDPFQKLNEGKNPDSTLTPVQLPEETHLAGSNRPGEKGIAADHNDPEANISLFTPNELKHTVRHESNPLEDPALGTNSAFSPDKVFAPTPLETEDSSDNLTLLGDNLDLSRLSQIRELTKDSMVNPLSRPLHRDPGFSISDEELLIPMTPKDSRGASESVRASQRITQGDLETRTQDTSRSSGLWGLKSLEQAAAAPAAQAAPAAPTATVAPVAPIAAATVAPQAPAVVVESAPVVAQTSVVPAVTPVQKAPAAATTAVEGIGSAPAIDAFSKLTATADAALRTVPAPETVQAVTVPQGQMGMGLETGSPYEIYLNRCHNALRDCAYFTSRGISPAVIEHCRLGYDAFFNSNSQSFNPLRPGEMNTWQAAIIPLGTESYVACNINSPNQLDPELYYVGSEPCFNLNELLNPAINGPIFICASEFDALSLLSLNMRAVAVGHPNHINFLLNFFQRHAVGKCICYLTLPRTSGLWQNANEYLMRMLNSMSFTAHIVDLSYPYGSINEALIQDRELLLNKLLHMSEITDVKLQDTVSPNASSSQTLVLSLENLARLELAPMMYTISSPAVAVSRLVLASLIENKQRAVLYAGSRMQWQMICSLLTFNLAGVPGGMNHNGQMVPGQEHGYQARFLELPLELSASMMEATLNHGLMAARLSGMTTPALMVDTFAFDLSLCAQISPRLAQLAAEFNVPVMIWCSREQKSIFEGNSVQTIEMTQGISNEIVFTTLDSSCRTHMFSTMG